jgi:cyd operon protein YbgT
MGYFTWMLGVGFAVLLAILHAMGGGNIKARAAGLKLQHG